MTLSTMFCSTHGSGNTERIQAEVLGILHVFQGYLVCRQELETHRMSEMENSLNCCNLLILALVK